MKIFKETLNDTEHVFVIYLLWSNARRDIEKYDSNDRVTAEEVKKEQEEEECSVNENRFVVSFEKNE